MFADRSGLRDRLREGLTTLKSEAIVKLARRG